MKKTEIPLGRSDCISKEKERAPNDAITNKNRI